MRTYHKHSGPSIMPSAGHLSLLIPCQRPRQGNKLPCHTPQIHRQVIDFTVLTREPEKIFPVISLPAGKFAMLRRRGYEPGPAMPSSLAAVPPRIAMRSSSLKPGIDMTWSTGTLFHGNG